MLKPQHHLHIDSRIEWFNYATSFFLFSPLLSLLLYQNVSYHFHPNIWIYFTYFCFGASYYSNLWQLLSLTYPVQTSYLVFPWCWPLHHIVWYSLWTTLATFPELDTIPRNSHSWRISSNWTPSPSSDTIQHSKTWPLQQQPHPLISWHNQTGPFNKRQLDRPKTTLHRLVLSLSYSNHFCKFQYQQLPPMQQFLVQSLPVQQILRWQNLEKRHWQWICLIQVEDSEEEKGICVKDGST